MKCCDCPALGCMQNMDGEYSSWCKLGYEQLEYKNNWDYTYCRKQLKTIKNQLKKEREENANKI